MYNSHSIETVNSSARDINHTKPLYANYCFSNIPNTILSCFEGIDKEKQIPETIFGDMKKKYSKVVFFFLDAFGWSFFEKHKNRFLNEMKEFSVVSKLTSQFPSTTSAQVISIHSGTEVGEIGIYEWFYYEPLFDDIFSPLICKVVREDKSPEHYNVSHEALYPAKSIYQELEKHNIKSYMIQPSSITNNENTKHMTRGSIPVGYHTVTEGLVTLKNLIKEEKDRAYFHFYFSGIDSICHGHGPDSELTDAEINSFFMLFEEHFYKQLSDVDFDTLVIISADHGQTYINPDEMVFLNEKYPEIYNYIHKNSKGKVLAPMGSSRDLFLKIHDDKKHEAISFLREKIGDIAEIYDTEELINNGYFGEKKVTERFLHRIGNVVILPKTNKSVWWKEDGFKLPNFKGMHGGLSKEEMEIPLILFKI